jgi:hypothetical protein
MKATEHEVSYCLTETHKHVRTVQKNLNLFVTDLISQI